MTVGRGGYAALSERILRAAVRDRRPISGAIALTYRCNLRCVHCYLRGSRRLPELSTGKWRGLIDQIVDAGCLWLLITGGEPLLRPDFAELYRHAKRKGLLVSVFTNGVLVDDAVVDLWREWPPHVVEVSLYGYSRQGYGAVTGAAAARDRAFAAARRLAAAGVPLRLKTMALRDNVRELERLKELATRLGVQFRYDPTISPTLRGSAVTRCASLDPAAIVGLEVDDPQRLRAWSDFIARRPAPGRRNTLFDCYAGLTSFFIGPAGGLSLCSYDEEVWDLRRRAFLPGWNGALKARRRLPLPARHPCRDCRDRPFCDLCPALARLFTGSEREVPSTVCRLSHERGAAIRAALGGVQSLSGHRSR